MAVPMASPVRHSIVGLRPPKAPACFIPTCPRRGMLAARAARPDFAKQPAR